MATAALGHIAVDVGVDVLVQHNHAGDKPTLIVAGDARVIKRFLVLEAVPAWPGHRRLARVCFIDVEWRWQIAARMLIWRRLMCPSAYFGRNCSV